MTFSVTISGQTMTIKAKSAGHAAAKAAGKVFGSVLPRGNTMALVSRGEPTSGKMLMVTLSNP